MSNKRSLEQSSHSDTSATAPSTTTTTTNSSNQSKKVKFATQSTATKSFNQGPIFEPIDQSSDLNFDELNQVGKIKKGRVRTEGYESDSSTENTDIRIKKKKSKEDDDDDIFGDENQDDDQNNSKLNSKFEQIDVGLNIKKGAEVKDYLDLGDIEGQEFGEEEEEGDKKRNEGQIRDRESLTKEEDYSDEEEDFVPGDEFANADDAPRARRKSKKGMGFLLSRFNMAEELQEGRMAADGSYVPSAKDPDAVHDNWLEGVNTKKTIKQAREAKRKRDEQLQNQVEKDQAISSLCTRKDCYIGLLALLPAGDGRTVSQIICQLGKIKQSLSTTKDNKKKKKIIQKKSSTNTIIENLISESIILDEDNHHSENEKETSTNKKEQEILKLDQIINEITDLASTLMGSHGDLDIYDLTHGSIIGILKSEGLVTREWSAPSNEYLEQILDSKITDKPTNNTYKKSEGVTTQKTIISRPTKSNTNSTVETNQPLIYYKFIQSDQQSSVDPNKIFGPFDPTTMKAWNQQGFFGLNFATILVKLDLSLDGLAPWGPWNQIFPN